jgi:hypothetical protein
VLTQPVEADLTVPAGTPQSAPVTLTVPVKQGWVGRARLTVPDGHNGLTGWQLILDGTPIIPYAGSGFIITNDAKWEFELNRDVNLGQLQVAGYNTGTYPHTFYFVVWWQAQAPAPPVTASLASSTAVPAATDQAVADLTGSDLTAADLTDVTDLSAGADSTDLDTVDTSDAPEVDVSELPPAPDASAPPPVVATAPVNRALAPSPAAGVKKLPEPLRREQSKPPTPRPKPKPHEPAKPPAKPPVGHAPGKPREPAKQ